MIDFMTETLIYQVFRLLLTDHCCLSLLCPFLSLLFTRKHRFWSKISCFALHHDRIYPVVYVLFLLFLVLFFCWFIRKNGVFCSKVGTEYIELGTKKGQVGTFEGQLGTNECWCTKAYYLFVPSVPTFFNLI